MREMRVLIFGSGSGIPIIDHFNESVLIEVDGCSYLFDAGEPIAATMHTRTVLGFYGVSDRFQADTPNVSIYSIRSIFISHFDADHVSGLPMLLQVMHLWRKRGEGFRFKPENKLALYLPEEAMKPFRDFIQALHLSKLRYELEILPVEEGEFYVDEMAKVTAFKNTHIKDGDSYSFLLRAEGKRVVYSGDLGNELEVLPLIQNRADLMIVECAHFSPERLFQALEGREIGKLVVNHIHPKLYGHEEEIEKLGEKHLSCDVIVGSDNLEIDV